MALKKVRRQRAAPRPPIDLGWLPEPWESEFRQTPDYNEHITRLAPGVEIVDRHRRSPRIAQNYHNAFLVDHPERDDPLTGEGSEHRGILPRYRRTQNSD